ncbi:hypothetical protein ACUSIJ_04850 [Pseudochelatococcus sp. B33]
MKLAGDSIVSEETGPNILKGLERTINDFLHLDTDGEEFILMYNRCHKSIERFSKEIESIEFISDLEKDEYTGILRQVRHLIRETVVEKIGIPLPAIEAEGAVDIATLRRPPSA